MKIVRMYQKRGIFLVPLPLNTDGEVESLLVPTRELEFIVASSNNDINFFEDNLSLPSSFYFTISINDSNVYQQLTNLSFSEGDRIKIRLDNNSSHFPFWKPPLLETSEEELSEDTKTGEQIEGEGIPGGETSEEDETINSDKKSTETNPCKIYMIMTSLPHMYIDEDTEATDFSFFLYEQDITVIPENFFIENPSITTFESCFQNCRRMMNIPADIFMYNTQVQSFKSCFQGTSIFSIPQGLFDHCTEVTDFSNCFSGDSIDDQVIEMHISSIPIDLFKYNTKVTNFNNCFRYNLDSFESTELPEFSLIIGSPNVTECDNFCSNKMKMTLYVPADSTTFDSFTALGMENITIIPFDDIENIPMTGTTEEENNGNSSEDNTPENPDSGGDDSNNTSGDNGDENNNSDDSSDGDTDSP